MVSCTSHIFYMWNNIYLWINRNNFTWQPSLHLEAIVRSVYMELWFVTAVSSPVSLVTARQVTYWTKFEPSRLGQREGEGGGGLSGRQDCPTSDVQVFFISKIQGELRNNYCRGFRPRSILWFLECSLKVILFALSRPSNVLLVFSYLLFFWPE